MKRLLIALACLAMSGSSLAQNANDPASRDDVVLLLRTMRSHDMMERTMDAMIKPMREMYHQRFAQEKDSLPPDFEARMSKIMSEMFKGMPMDEMTQAMIPVYQKHFTHGDVEALNTFYSSSVGQKFLEETPAVTAEYMQAMIPILTRYSEKWQRRMEQEFDGTQKNAPAKSGGSSSSQN